MQIQGIIKPMSELTPQTVPAGWHRDGAGLTRWWDGQQWTDHVQPQQQPPVMQQAQPMPYPAQQPVYVNTTVQPKRVNHVLHLILTVLTVGLWLPVWIIISMAKS